MALTASLTTSYGETRDLYVRVNNLSTSNHGVSSSALYRGYIVEEQFRAGGGYVWERELEFMVDVSGDIWTQAYQALKEQPEFAGSTDC
ncbi:hypothetical protein [Pseudomonas fluorescens]|uniref:hypothetical protein n=1 Tax=Pseudomonas fluorescens TaxID=294 RepID=UPI0012495FA4|nr:hypothetical protein [Pseudomonas fluorescens]CAG8864063.1 hypothetical protein PS861_00161 [Pseudomonas fluorescens]